MVPGAGAFEVAAARHLRTVTKKKVEGRAKLGVEPAGVVDLNDTFRQQGYRKEMGVKAAVALLFNKRYLKSKKAATSNWANPHLTEAQISYAANDAYAAMRVAEKLI